MSSPPWDHDHGHLYRVEIAVSGPLDQGTRGIVDLNELDRVISESVIVPLSGQHLNEVVPPFVAGQQPTCEAMAAWLWQQLEPRLGNSIKLERVMVAEDDTLRAECFGTQ
jgi:6-pyruvoyltetrahydropterin/6-carboxytetrahydropterin synthase